jgi:hypothetical protein
VHETHGSHAWVGAWGAVEEGQVEAGLGVNRAVAGHRWPTVAETMHFFLSQKSTVMHQSLEFTGAFRPCYTP